MAAPKRQHIIPCLHLRHFTDKDSHVWNYDALAGKLWPSTPEDTAVEGHFYSGERADGTMDTTIEEHLSKVESAAAPTYSVLLAGNIPGKSQERADFAHFLGLMYSRTRAMRRMAAEVYGREVQIMMYFTANHPQAFDSAISSYEKEIGRQLTPEEREGARKSFLDPSRFEFEIPKDRTFSALGVADNLAPMFFNMNWYLMTASEGFFITSDNPLVREVHRSTVHPFYGDQGFLNKTAEVTFPLSSSKLLLMSWSDAPRRATLTLDLVHRANEARAAQSDQFLYSHVKSAEIEQLAARFRDSRPAMTTQGLGPEKFGKIRVDNKRQKPASTT